MCWLLVFQTYNQHKYFIRAGTPGTAGTRASSGINTVDCGLWTLATTVDVLDHATCTSPRSFPGFDVE